MDGLLKVSNLRVAAGRKVILEDINFSLQKNELLIVGGPNGAGKSTLIRAIMNIVRSAGTVLLFDRDIREYSIAERARKIAVLGQMQSREFDYSAEDVVRFGLYNRRKGFFDLGFSTEDYQAADNAMEQTGVRELAKRSITTLSGGELQRVYLAQALTQNPDILILDEPTNNLDIGFQLNLFETIKKWQARENKAVIAIVHDLKLCSIYADRILLLNNGRQIALGTPKEVFTHETIKSVYNALAADYMSRELRL